MACGFGACFGCVVPARGGGYLRVCVDGPVLDAERARARRASTRGRRRERRASAGCELAHPVINGSGTFDAIAAARGVRRRPAARTSRSPPTCPRRSRCEPRAGNPPPRLWEAPAGLINSIGLPNKGLEGYLREDLPAARRMHARHDGGELRRAADHERDGLERRASSRAGRGLRRARARSPRSSSTCPARTSRPASTSAPTPSSCADGARASVRARTGKPLIVKLTPNTADVPRARGGRGRRAPTPSR